MKVSISKTRIYTFLSITFLFLSWKGLSMYFNSEMILPSPESTLISVIKLIISKDFAIIIFATISRGLLGFVISLILGLGLGILAGINKNFNAFLAPILVTIRSTPVISLILLALIWFKVNNVPIFIAFLTMFPFICTNVIDGIRNVDKRLVEMAVIYKTPHQKIVREVYIPAISPFIFSGITSAIGFGWRAVIIGEVLSQPRFGIGTLMQTAQTYLLVDEVIAWTVIAVIISFAFERLIRLIERKIIVWR